MVALVAPVSLAVEEGGDSSGSWNLEEYGEREEYGGLPGPARLVSKQLLHISPFKQRPWPVHVICAECGVTHSSPGAEFVYPNRAGASLELNESWFV